MYPECNTHVLLVATLGYVVLFFFLLSALWSVLQAIRAILAPLFLPHEETSLPKKYGPWALITGCTDGIGKAYTVELAKRGLNIVLVSRNQDKLQETARMLEIEYTVKTKIIQTDFSLGADAINVIKKQIGLLDIGILVNNVGKQYEYPMYLAEVSEKDLWDMITINVGAVTLLCRLLVDGMKKRGRGAIVNISSGSELQPLPLMTVYAATKVENSEDMTEAIFDAIENAASVYLKTFMYILKQKDELILELREKIKIFHDHINLKNVTADSDSAHLTAISYDQGKPTQSAEGEKKTIRKTMQQLNNQRNA